MNEASERCAYCGYSETEHGPNGLARCDTYDPELRPRVYILASAESERQGRGEWKTYDSARDYVILEVPAEDWTVAYLLAVQHGGFVVAEIRIFPTEPAGEAEPGEWTREVDRVPVGGLTGRRLRSVGVTAHRTHADVIHDTVREAMGDAAFEAFMDERGLSEERLAAFAATLELSSDRLTRLAQIAGLYVTATNKGSSSPVAVVAERLSVSRSSVRDQLHDAREAGLLAGFGVGVAGGILTARARELLGMMMKEEE
jgi:hypothetical protein